MAKVRTNMKVASWTIAVLFVIVVFVFVILYFSLESQFEVKTQDFSVSFLASYLQDIIFFSLIGAAAWFYGMRRPQSEILDSRIWYLYSSPHATDDALKYNREQIEKLAAFGKSSESHITVTDYDSAIKAYKVHFIRRSIFQNLFEDREYRDSISIRIEPDVIPSLHRVEGIEHSNGELVLVQSTVLGDSHDGPKRHITHPIKIKQSALEREVELTIQENGSIMFEFEFWLWCLVGESQWIRVLRYTKELKIDISNKSKTRVAISQEGQEGKLEIIEPDAKYDFKKRFKFKPTDTMTFWWREPPTAPPTPTEKVLSQEDPDCI